MKMYNRLLRIMFASLLLAAISLAPACASDEKIPMNDSAVQSLDYLKVPEEGFKFVVWGDCRDDKGKFDDVMLKINELHPLFSIGLGDYVSSGTRKEYNAFIPRLKTLQQPLISVIGNHDTPRPGREIWLKEFGDTNFCFDFGGVRFICLDNADYNLDKDELTFLEERLQTDLKTIVLAHSPPDYDRWGVHSFKKGSAALLALMEKYQVDYAFFAHIHLYDEMKIGPTMCVISGGAGAPLYGGFDFGGPNIHVVEVTVTPDGISHRYVPVYDK